MIGLSYGFTNAYCGFCGTDWATNYHGGTGCFQVGGSPTGAYANIVGYACPVKEPEPMRDLPRIDKQKTQRRTGSVAHIRPLTLSRGTLPRARGNC